jgi:hypothetical protein
MAKVKEKKLKKKKIYNLKTRIVAGIRKVWRFSPLRTEVKKRCRVKIGIYRCEKCRKLTDHVDIDHKEPAVDPVLGWQGYDIFIQRLFCDVSNLQGICLRCHELKSDKESKVRKVNKKKISLDKDSSEV